MHTARTTSGQSLSISYDAVTNTLQFREHNWFAEPLRSTGATQSAQVGRRATPAAVIRRRRDALRRGSAA